ncbi:MAG: helix-turn-helix transcriptional regulator [Selenomonas sp.]|nr:helix-turn-helix transcriptional regulator [Selenomonas sp.]
MIWKNTFHQRINELWERAKDKDYRLTMEAYAKHIGTTRSSLRGWLAGKGQPDAEGFVRVATTENVSLEWLLGDQRTFVGCSYAEQELVRKFRSLSDIHQEDILVFLERYYMQDTDKMHAKLPPST